MKGKGFKNLLIDFGGVLIDLDRQRCIDNFKKLGCAQIDEQLNVYHQEGFFKLHEMGVISSTEFRNKIRETIGRPVNDKQIDEAWNSFLVGIPTYKLELLLRLRKEYAVYLLSNTNEIHWEWSVRNAFPFRSFGVEDYFDKVYLSFKMKRLKPNPDIFKAVLDDAGIAAEETFFIDDSKENCETAQTLGISTYTPKAREDWSHLFDSERAKNGGR